MYYMYLQSEMIQYLFLTNFVVLDPKIVPIML